MNTTQWGVGPLSQNCVIPRERGGRGDGTSTCLDEREREKKKERAFGWNERVVVVTTRESAIVLLATGRGELLVFKLYRPGGLRPSAAAAAPLSLDLRTANFDRTLLLRSLSSSPRSRLNLTLGGLRSPRPNPHLLFQFLHPLRSVYNRLPI